MPLTAQLGLQQMHLGLQYTNRVASLLSLHYSWAALALENNEAEKPANLGHELSVL